MKLINTESVTGAMHPRRRLLVACLIVYDILAVSLSYAAGLWIRFESFGSNIPQECLHAFCWVLPWYTIVCIVIFMMAGLYRSVWRFAGFVELRRLVLSTVIETLLMIVMISPMQRMPAAFYVVGPVLQFALTAAIRFSYRYMKLRRYSIRKRAANYENAMIIGAGAAGRIVARELKNVRDIDCYPCCFIDDDRQKWGTYLDGVPVVGGREYILSAVEKYKINQILFAIPSASMEQKREILNICKETDCELRNLPAIYQLANGEVILSKMRPVAIEDLLGRETIKVNMEEIFRNLKDKTILVTGGGGSIGSELCRQIAAHGPKLLIIFDIYENNAYDIEQELKRNHPELNLLVLIGSVRDSRRINYVFETYKPDIVYHAAAHKHVPLMETSPNEAIKNNVVGTYKTALAAMKNGTDRFVLISTDKAVNPTNIMGASKRLCEMVIQSMDAVSKMKRYDLLPDLKMHGHTDELSGDEALTKGAERSSAEAVKRSAVDNLPESFRTHFVAVRFGNVLGSNGSVVPLFKKQILDGGPVTVTHPDIIRYFMTIPEAVSLVLEAGTYAHGGEIFVFDMGTPVKIDTLARNLIRLSGYRPDVDIKVEYTGLRPGEKLYEEKLMAEEGLEKTANDLIFVGKPIPFDREAFFGQLTELTYASYNNSENIVEMVREVVPTFKPE